MRPSIGGVGEICDAHPPAPASAVVTTNLISKGDGNSTVITRLSIASLLDPHSQHPLMPTLGRVIRSSAAADSVHVA